MKVGDKVEILPIVASLQPDECKNNGLVVRKKYNQYGTIISINGEYIIVKPKYRKWEIECYENELKIITEEQFKSLKSTKTPSN
jgi:hypothetical protein